MQCKARQVLRDLLSNNQGTHLQIAFVAGATVLHHYNEFVSLISMSGLPTF